MNRFSRRYFYYPGCSLEGTAREYDISTRALMAALGAELIDIPDWNCCGASAAASESELLSLALPALNLAKAGAFATTAGTGAAAKAKTGAPADILTPCSACYLNLKRAEIETARNPSLRARVNTVLAEAGLQYNKGGPRTRHLLDILSRDIGPDRLSEVVRRPLSGLRVAPYYGCQCLRPYAVFDDPEIPATMTPLLLAAGADVFPWSMAARCCGAAHMNTDPEVGIALITDILSAARGADLLVTVCPMCQINLEAYQKKASHRAGEDLSITVLYLPQLLGLAAGLDEAAVSLGDNLAVEKAFMDRVSAAI